MKERPILFTAPMARALLDGTKTQTRRVVKPEGAHHLFQFRGTTAAKGADEPTGEWAWCGSERVVNKHIYCPYGKPGDRLWVRETWQAVSGNDRARHIMTHPRPDRGWLEYAATPRADEPAYKWRPSIHMPRWASRIMLEVTGVRVERLQDISEADAMAEGVTAGKYTGLDRAYARAYSDLWEQINGPGSWDANPWVWVIEFKRFSPAR